jgi:citrate synthase
MEECKVIVNTGLRGVTVASTKISDVRGEEGKLIYRGYLIQDLAEKTCFEEIVHLLLYEKLPTATQLKSLKQRLNSQRAISPAIIAALKTMPADALPMDILQAGVCLLASHDPDIRDTSRPATERMAIRLIAKLPTFLSAWERIRKAKEPIAPDPELDHGANFLYMLNGRRPEPQVAKFMDSCLVLHAEHSFNASTFAAREVASTRAHIYAAVSAAVGSLSGELHGGANVRVMQMLLNIATADKAEAYVNQILDQGKKIMGLGHAVYKTDDPRAGIIALMSKRMGELAGDTKWYEISRILEVKGKQAFKERKGTDICKCRFLQRISLLFIRIPWTFSHRCLPFVGSRMGSACDRRALQKLPPSVLYRPESDYVGDYCGPSECTFVPMDQR